MQLKTLYAIFYLAVIMFVARPFIGYSISLSGAAAIELHSILAKSFSKRKPEDLEDAKAKASEIQQKLTNPPQTISLTIIALLGLFFPISFKRNYFAGQSFLTNLKSNLLPAEHPYLLSGKLII